MKIGIFDSGLGGLKIAKSVIQHLPRYDYIYLGDTKRVPYGNRSQETIYQFTKECVEYLFKHNCVVVIVACNTASARALRKLQRTWLSHRYPERRVLGVIVPTIETVAEKGCKRVGVIATQASVNSKTFVKEFKKRAPQVNIVQHAAPLLVPLIENNGKPWMQSAVHYYTKPLLKKKIDAIILGSTHYTVIKRAVQKAVGKNVKVISQDDIIPRALADYLQRHPELERRVSRKRRRSFLVTDITPHFQKTSTQWFGKHVRLKKVNIA